MATTSSVRVPVQMVSRGKFKLEMKWKKLRRIVDGKPEPEVYERKKKILEVLKKLAAQGTLDLRYLDETGFCPVLRT